MDLTGHDQVQEATRLDRLGVELVRLYRETGNIDHLHESVKLARQAVDLCSDSERPAYLSELSRRLRERFEREGKVQDLSESLQLAQHAIIASRTISRRILDDESDSPDDRSAEGSRSVEASSTFSPIDEPHTSCPNSPSSYRGYPFSRLEDLGGLDQTIKVTQEPVEFESGSRQGWIKYLNNLGIRYQKSFEDLEKALEPDNAFDTPKQTINSSNDTKLVGGAIYIERQDTPLGNRLNSTGVNLHAIETPDPKDDEEEEAFQAPMAQESMIFKRLDSPLSLSFGPNSDMDSRRSSAYLAQATWDTTPSDAGDFADIPVYLAERLGYHSETPARVASLEQAIELQTRFLEATPHDHPSRTDYLLTLSNHLHYRYQTLGSIEDLDMAIRMTEEAINLGPVNDSERSVNLCALSRRLRDRYMKTEAVADIRESIQLARKAMDGISRANPNRAICLNELSIGLEISFLRTGWLTDLETAIRASQEALTIASLDDPIRAELLYSLSSQLTHRFEQIGALVDLQEAIYLMQKVVHLTPFNHPCRVSFLYTLGNQFGSLYKRTDTVSDLNRAIEMGQQASAIVREDEPIRVSILNSLSVHLGARFLKTKSTADLNEAILLGQKALNMILYRHPDRPVLLHNLSCRLLDRFRSQGHISDLQEAVRKGSQAVDAAPQGHPNCAMYLNHLGSLLRDPCVQGGQIITGNREPVALFTEALQQYNAPPLDRIKAGQNAFDCHVRKEDWAKATTVARDVVQLLPWLVPRWLNRDDQQHLIKNMTNFSSLAASAVLQAGGSAAEAVEMLEAGRGVIGSLTIDLRADISGLQRIDPLLYNQYIQLRRQILLPSGNGMAPSADTLKHQRTPGSLNFQGLKTNFSNAISRRTESMKELEAIEQKIRTISGFEHFRVPLSAADFVELAQKGPVAAFNVTEYRSDALIATKRGIVSIPLDLSLDELKRNAARLVGNERLSRGKPSTKAKRNKELRDIMQWLWEAAVRPVLLHLGLMSTKPEHHLPRLWWVASGYMGLFPLHAAGDEQSVTMDYVISSYTPTFKGLRFSREKGQRPSPPDADVKMLIVPVPETMGKPSLKTHDEIEAIQRSMGSVTYTVLDMPSKTDILRELSRHHFIHFACHGSPDPNNPSDAALLLAPGHDGNPERLTVREISMLNHDDARLAYLSACSTAENSAEELMDEIIHVASAFQLIGFPHVVGTLWDTSDKAAVQVAKLFYEEIGRRLGDPSTSRCHDIAYCLHQALQRIRLSPRVARSKDVLSWAPFIHMGA
ncbi:hypothetical protein DTO027B5_1912 [Paecilomyces variotii]|nr:hypothetical protein DTO169C6_992 [Paecilomyces variotii]KAJ9327524.1 hypothetical protein DTO027B3_1746 [Paecilomyces variotii]KAJ9336231.1 hypothetical protein DTO027B5_1912 [Paecilomyces variotii]